LKPQARRNPGVQKTPSLFAAASNMMLSVLKIVSTRRHINEQTREQVCRYKKKF